MDINFKRQILNDFSISEEEFEYGGNIFVVNNPNDTFLFYNKSLLSIIIFDNRIFLRSSDNKIIKTLKEEYSTYPGQWFTEFDNIKKLESILTNHKLKIDNFFPLMTFSERYVKARNFTFDRIDKNDIIKYKDISNIPIAFDDDDRIGISFHDGNKLIALCGASTIGKYLRSLGIEKFYFDDKYKGLSSSMVRSLAIQIKAENSHVSPIYTTQFSHTDSINTAIRAGFEMNVCICASKN